MSKTAWLFFLADRGFDVWLGGNRGVILEHKEVHSRHEKFWDWSLDDLARYDMPAIVDFVLHKTGRDSVSWIGLSQGNAQAFIGLSSNKELAKKVNLMIALAPTGRLGDLPTWPLRVIRDSNPIYVNAILGNTEFIPLMNIPNQFLPAWIFAELAYPMFNYLFKWSDTRWKKTRKPKYFQFTPRPNSTKLIKQYMAMTKTGRLETFGTGEPYPLEEISTPLALFHGTSDYLCKCTELVELFRTNNPSVLKHVEEIEEYEHMDLIWAEDSHVKVYPKIVDVLHKHTPAIKETRTS
eukprot:NODE_509_length_1414_cov_98.146076_g475_i0.p1 GENE.NODE_509_length_1414_cov_98.146076_g475_i0~~NODE_509_length_1414_cov_98.146076_g475_i0.p1  ORF type:complete len:294 (-),score=24.12 NODE_509_length_1414_cov_98.146076_g475_i0:36-917(-)